MNINVSVTVELGESVKKLVEQLLNTPSTPRPATGGGSSGSVSADTAGAETPAAGKGKGKGKGKEAEAAPAAEDSKPAAAEKPAAKEGDISDDECRDALSRLAEAKSMDDARKILGDYKVIKVSDVPQEKRKAFIDACDKAAI